MKQRPHLVLQQGPNYFLAKRLRCFKAAWYLYGADALLEAASFQYAKQFGGKASKGRRGAAEVHGHGRMGVVAKVVETEQIGPYKSLETDDAN